MGGASSKAARQLPKTAAATKPSWAGARTPGFGEQPQQPPSHASAPPESGASHDAGRASETRTEAIERDSRDPHFLSKLNQLGPVKVDHHMQTIRPAADHAKRVYEARLASELDARSLQPSHNRLHAASLADLLDERKAAETREDVEWLAQRYGVDVAKLESVARYVNTPTADPASTRRVRSADGEETVTMKAMWVDPPAASTSG